VDRRGDIYRARQFDGDPTSADPNTHGELLATEAVKYGTPLARFEEPDIITTRTNVSCVRNGLPTSCGEVRSVSRRSESAPCSAELFTLYQGSSEDDDRLDVVSELNDLGPRNQGSPVLESGPLVSAMQPWQNAPPVHGTQYLHYRWNETVSAPTTQDTPTGEQETSGTRDLTFDLWVDEASRLPLKVGVTDDTDGVPFTRYWTYDKQRLEDAEVPEDYFHSPEPATVEEDKRVYLYDDEPPGALVEPGSGARYGAFGLGDEPTVAGHRYCRAATIVESLTESTNGDIPRHNASEPELSGDPVAVESGRTLIAYNELAPNEVCAPGKGALDAPSLIVRSAPAQSTLALAWRQAYVDLGKPAPQLSRRTATLRSWLLIPPAVRAQPAHRVLALGDGRSGVYTQRNGTAIVATGPFGEAELDRLADLLEES
jgi:hypothetical protein